MRGRRNATGERERELQSMTGTAPPASMRRRQGIIQNNPGEPHPHYYPPRPPRPNQSLSRFQTILNLFSNNPPAANANQFSIPQRIRDGCPRLPVLTRAFLPEFPLLFYTPTPSRVGTRARVPQPADLLAVAQPNTQPPGIDSQIRL